jgi:surface protein
LGFITALLFILQGFFMSLLSSLTLEKKTFFQTSLGILFAGSLSACGGGGGGSSADMTKPVITITGSSSVEHAYGTDYVDQGATVTDNVDTSVELVVTGVNAIDVYSLDTNFIVTYSATDSAGNTATETRSVLVTDLTGPTITLNSGKDGNETVILGVGRVYNELGATATDDVDTTALEVIIDSTLVDAETLGEYSVTYSATDEAGNTTEVIRTVNVVESRPFITTWKTDNDGVSEDNQIMIGTNSNSAVYNYNVVWGDGETDEGLTGDYTHTYSQAGTYQVEISGDFPQIFFQYDYDNDKLLTVEQWGDVKWFSASNGFFKTSNFKSKATDTPDLRNVSDMSYMFFQATAFNSDINDWDVSKVIDMEQMFGSAVSFDQDLSTWQISSVTGVGLGQMFEYVELSVTNYDALLNSWSQQNVNPDLPFDSGCSEHSSAAQAAYDILTSAPNNWTIDGTCN